MVDNMFVFRITAELHWFWYILGTDFLWSHQRRNFPCDYCL